MTIQSEIITALSGVAGNRVFPDSAPETAPTPLVVIKRQAYEPLMLLTGSSGLAKSTFLFMCWGAKVNDQNKTGAKTVALDTAAAVRAAINFKDTNGSQFKSFFEETVSGDDFEPDTLEVMEPVSFSFWHGA